MKCISILLFTSIENDYLGDWNPEKDINGPSHMTPVTQMVIFNRGVLLLGSNHFLILLFNLTGERVVTGKTQLESDVVRLHNTTRQPCLVLADCNDQELLLFLHPSILQSLFPPLTLNKMTQSFHYFHFFNNQKRIFLCSIARLLSLRQKFPSTFFDSGRKQESFTAFGAS